MEPASLVLLVADAFARWNPLLQKNGGFCGGGFIKVFFRMRCDGLGQCVLAKPETVGRGVEFHVLIATSLGTPEGMVFNRFVLPVAASHMVLWGFGHHRAVFGFLMGRGTFPLLLSLLLYLEGFFPRYAVL